MARRGALVLCALLCVLTAVTSFRGSVLSSESEERPPSTSVTNPIQHFADSLKPSLRLGVAAGSNKVFPPLVWREESQRPLLTSGSWVVGQ